MSSEWEIFQASQVCGKHKSAMSTGPFGSAISSRFFVNNGVPVIRGGNLSQDVGTRLNHEDLVFITEDKAREFERSTVKHGDLIFTCWGTIDQVGLVDERSHYEEYVISNKQMKMTPDPVITDSRFLYYQFSSPKIRSWIIDNGIGSSVPGFNLGMLKSIELNIPPLPEQQAIAHILGTLDDKIELNRKTNETLEEIAKALFKSWFVDFDPVRAKAVGRSTGLPAEISDLFPDSFEDSELGEIPSGWEIKKIGDVISRLPVGKRFDQKTVSPKGSIPVLDQSASGIVGYHDEEAGVLAREDFPLFTFANHTCAMRYMTRPFSVIQNVFPLRGNGVDTAWLYQASQGRQEITEYKGHYPDFIEKQVVVPANGTDKIYGGGYERILIKCDFNLINSAFLASIRDALLPKLISGEIQIPDAEKMLEEVGI